MGPRTITPLSLFLLALSASLLVSFAGYLWYGIPLRYLVLHLIAGLLVAATAVAAYRSLRRCADAGLVQQHAYYQGIIESRHESILIIDRDFRIRDVNENLLRTTGRGRDALLGMPCHAVLHGRTSRCAENNGHLCPAAAVFKTGAQTSCVHRHARYDGKSVDVEVSAAPLRAKNGPVPLVVVTIRDVTELNHLKALFLQAQKMETVGRLAGGMAHDFNNLMNVVIGYSEMLLNKMPQDHPRRPALESILDAGERAAHLTSQLLAFSRKQVIEPRVWDPNLIIKNMEQLLRRIIGEDVDLRVAPVPDAGRVKADLGMVEQVIMNLAVNARDAMPKGGTLTIETANAALDERYARTHPGAAPGPYVMLAVSDTGLGMTPEVRRRIFEPFFTTKETGKGTGLGLSTVYGIIKQHHGYIMAYSEPGLGTTFKIYLPRVDDEAEAVVRKAEAVVPRGRETILLVEDDESLRTMAVMMLEELGYRVLACSCGDEALERLSVSGDPVDLLFTDLVMPGMNGTALAKQARALRPALKVLYTSGYTDQVASHAGVLEQDTPFVQKPYTSAVIGRKVRAVLES